MVPFNFYCFLFLPLSPEGSAEGNNGNERGHPALLELHRMQRRPLVRRVAGHRDGLHKGPHVHHRESFPCIAQCLVYVLLYDKVDGRGSE